MSEQVPLSDVVARARERFAVGHNCAQSVLGALQEFFGYSDESLALAATGFGSGMGRRQIVCGAVTGAVMGLGLVTSRQRKRTIADEAACREEVYARVRELTGRFESEFGTVCCREMLGCDLMTPEGQSHFAQCDLMERVCHRAVGFAVKNAITICGAVDDPTGD